MASDESDDASSKVGGGRSAVYRAWRVLRPVLIAYLLVVLLMTFLETWLVYPIPPQGRGEWQPKWMNYEDVWFTAEDGTKLHGWFIPHERPKRALLYCHGNGEAIGDNADLMAHLSRVLDASVMIVDYRGYGHSEGTPSEAGCIADGLAAQRWLADRLGVDTSDIVLMGRSIGGAVVVAMAAEQGAQAVVLENAFSRLTDVAASHYPWLPVRLLMKNRYDTVGRIQRYDGPVFQSHGSLDTIVPIRMGRELFEAVPSEDKTFVEFPDLDHNDPPPPDYYRQLAAFLDSVSQKHPVPKPAPDLQTHLDGG
jgi:hypothetical protein